MRRTLSLISSILLVALYLGLGAMGILGVAAGDPLAWIAVAVSVVGLALRGLVVWARRRQRLLVTAQEALRAEPGYVAPEEPAGPRRRRVLAISLAYIGPFVLAGVGAIVAVQFLTESLRLVAVVLAVVFLAVSAGLGLVLARRLRALTPQ